MSVKHSCHTTRICLIMTSVLMFLLLPCPILCLTDLTLTCTEAGQGHLSQLVTQVRYVSIENCVNLTLDIFHSVPIIISSLLLVNMTNLQLVLGPQSLSNIGELVLIQSTLVGNVTFVSKTGASLTVENCTFQNDLFIYSLDKQSSRTLEYEAMFFINENVFDGAVEIFIKDARDTRDTLANKLARKPVH